MLLILLFCFFLTYCLSHPLTAPGGCKENVWRDDSSAYLPGKCFGVNPTSEFPEYRDLGIINFRQCRSLCCNLKEKCTTWQFQNSTKTCFIQKRPVRRGFEGADTPLYCDPFPPNSWNGRVMKSKSNGKCEWGETLPGQCFGFGPERLGKNGEKLNATSCEEACCKDETCNSWQELPDRGCYFGKSDCKHTPVEGAYMGGRKCLVGFCGGNDEQAKRFNLPMPDLS